MKKLTLLVAHNHYQLRGGEDSVFEAECALLEQDGHRVIRYEKSNEDIPRNTSMIQKLKLFRDTIWNPTTTREIAELIDAEHPDIVHCHNTFPIISPSIYWICKKKNVPVIQTLHNYRLTCLNGYLYREGEICRKCLGKCPLHGIVRKCYRDALFPSITLAMMLVIHRLIGTFRHKVTRFIALTETGRQHFIQAGLPKDKIVVKPNFVYSQVLPMSSNSTPSSKTFLYAGRLSPEKGPDILIKAWKHLPFLNATLEIAGSGPMLSELQMLAQNAANPIHFLGHLDRASLSKHMQQATAVIFPSRLYETFGLSAFEANALGTPVILSDCIVTASHIQPRQTGLLFRANNTRDLADQITSMIQKPFRVSTPIPTDITPSGNLALLLNLYESLLPKNS